MKEKFTIIDASTRTIQIGSKYFKGEIGTMNDGVIGCPGCVFNEKYTAPCGTRSCDYIREFRTYCSSIIANNSENRLICFNEIENPNKRRRESERIAVKKSRQQSEFEREIISLLL